MKCQNCKEKIKGKAHSISGNIGSFCQKCWDISETEDETGDAIICPHCGYTYPDPAPGEEEEDSGGLVCSQYSCPYSLSSQFPEKEHIGDIVCPHCEKKFVCIRNITYTMKTRR